MIFGHLDVEIYQSDPRLLCLPPLMQVRYALILI